MTIKSLILQIKLMAMVMVYVEICAKENVLVYCNKATGVKKVQIRSYFCSEYRKIRTRNNTVLRHISRSATGAYMQTDTVAGS